MRRFILKKQSIYFQMLILLLAAATLAVFLFALMESMSEPLVDRYLEETGYTEVQNKKRIKALQAYITENDIHSRDLKNLSQWVRKQKLLSVSIYKDGIQVFDSEHPDQEIWDAEIGFVNYDWVSYDTVFFSDGEAEIEITGAYRYQIYSMLQTVEMGISFLLFLVIVLLGIRRKMAYIRLLSREVEILESGRLDYHITVKGKDELSMLADGLESMRCSFTESRERADRIVRENQRVITEMSHDLRTPITSILLYIEIIRQGKCRDVKQEKEYVEKIRHKALQIKQRTDRLFEYSLKADDRKPSQVETGTFAEALYEPLSELIGFLQHEGFQVRSEIRWPDCRISYHMDYVVRIMDNVASNIVKYADVREPVSISMEEKAGFFGLLFRNRVSKENMTEESSGIGMLSIGRMMKEMGGESESFCLGQMFGIRIIFPVEEGRLDE